VEEHQGASRDNDQKQALRAYLQRAEVRLSTMHRVGGAFIGGAGLLVMLPLFMKDVVGALVEVLSSPAVSEAIPNLHALVCALPVIIAFAIPIYALYLLIRELLLFYFSANIPDQNGEAGDGTYHPRFALTAIPFANDEGVETKFRLREMQFAKPLLNFVLPHDIREKRWLKNLLEDPQTKSVAIPEDGFLPSRQGNSRSLTDADCLRMAFGLAGAYDRELIYEVAKSELSLIRHNLLLRRLVIRYIKALLLFVWTAMVLFVVSPMKQGHTMPDALVYLYVGFMVWSGFAPYWVRAPMRWIFREFDQNAPDKTSDPNLRSFELRVGVLCLVATIIGSYLGSHELHSSWVLYFGIPLLALNVLVILRSAGRLDSPALRWI
jgi:hypothetical protein